MGTLTAGGKIAAETEHIDSAAETLELLHIQACVGQDGSYTKISLHTMAGRTDINIPFAQITAAVAEITEAGETMMRRQLRNGSGKKAFQDIIRAAPAPSRVSPMVDPETGDCIFIYRFLDRLPRIIRLTMQQMHEARANLALDLKRYAN